MFSYFAEGPFYLIEILGLSPSNYGLSFVAIAASTMFGGIVSKKLQAYHTSQVVMGYGLLVVLAGAGLFSLLILLQAVVPMSNSLLIVITVASQMTIMFGVCMATSNALAGALVDYKTCIGTASSLFGFIYYCIIALFTFGIGGLHDDTLYPMPLYFLAIGCFMLFIKK
jgi:DHA1 family bicyclomycin/chloramphenicol resistance-like MFS transporter